MTTVPAPGTAAWWAARSATSDRPRRPRADGLTLDRILDTALAIVDDEGLDALTMRKLAGRLGAGHASLYRHVASHHEVVVLLVDRVLGSLSLTSAGGAAGPDGVRARSEAALRRYRRLLLDHPSLTPAFLAGQLLGPNAMARREEALAMLVDAGVPGPLAVQAYLTLTHFVIASAVFESSGAGRTADERAAMTAYFATLPADAYPTVTALAAELDDVDPQTEFDLGLTALLTHIERLAT